MKSSKYLALAALAIAIANSAWLYAQQRKLPSMLPPEDYLEIQQLYGYYARDVDSGTQRDASWMYTDDGLWDVQGTRIVGKEALKKWYAVTPPGMTKGGVRHFSTNLVLVPTAEGARGSAYMIAVERKSKGGPTEFTTWGKYEDRLVKTPKGWRFKERVWRADTYYDSTEKVTPTPFAAPE
jgi:hypothetical protein